MFIPDLGSRITDPKTATKERGEKKFVVKFHKIENYFIFEMLKENIWVNFQRIWELSQNMGLVSGIRKKPIPDPGSRGKKGTGSRIRIRNTEKYPFCFIKSLEQLKIFKKGLVPYVGLEN